MARTIVLIVLDGWGLGRSDESNPIYMVQPQTFKWLEENYPVTSLQASGISVGLPWGEVGNSEVGHLTLGAGKVVYQYYPRITLAVRDKTFFENKALKDAMAHANKNSSAVNLIGLLSKGNVHASVEHLEALIKMAAQEGVKEVKLHLFADGKDMPPKTLEAVLQLVPKEKLATLTGRYYAMDREGNWNLTQETYNALTAGGGADVRESFADVLKANYARGLDEEFLPALRFGGEEKNVKDGDAVIFFNFREDSIRQIASSFIEKEFDKFPRADFKDLHVATMTRYKEEWTDVPIAFDPDIVKIPLGKVLSDAGMTQLRLAETYKYAHVTYFFNGYEEPPYKNEYRVVIPSEPIPHPDEHPEMMAAAITDRLIEAIQGRGFGFILVNYANADAIAHTGNYKASEEAVRVLDRELGRVMQIAANPDTVVIVTSDHGNIEELLDPMTGRAETQHDPSPVPFYLIADEFKGRKFMNQANLRGETLGILSDVAPTILEILKIPKPTEMSGESLLKDLL
jgi:2,3-bisphosphoglycerate-independent phosphoglycerate mutase